MSGPPEHDHPDVVVCPGGPVLVRGAQTIQDAEGRVHTSARPVVALCRCARSARLPFCDGTHKLLPESARP